MEGKGVRTPFGTVIMGVLILTLFVAQTQVEAKSCCPSTTARNTYNVCRFTGVPSATCASLSGCKIVDGTCPDGYNNGILENSGDAINEYCKLGCASSVCNAAIITLQNSVAGEESVKVAVEKCNNACSEFCTKGSAIASETS